MYKLIIICVFLIFKTEGTWSFIVFSEQLSKHFRFTGHIATVRMMSFRSVSAECCYLKPRCSADTHHKHHYFLLTHRQPKRSNAILLALSLQAFLLFPFLSINYSHFRVILRCFMILPFTSLASITTELSGQLGTGKHLGFNASFLRAVKWSGIMSFFKIRRSGF